MITLGIDMGSNTVKAVAVRDGREVLGSNVVKTSHDLEGVTSGCVQACLDASGATLAQCAYIVATGYGRVSCSMANKDVSEITCHARGAFFRLPATRTVIDIGGQDSKVITISDNGRALDFVMNDKCAAGTGRFLEVMAQALGVPLGGFAEIALRSSNPVTISNTCTVFAESEVIGLMARKNSIEDIVAGLHASIATRVNALANRLRIRDDIALTGGVALNAGVRAAIEKASGKKLHVPPEPQIIGALGAALIAADSVEKK
jgi:(R)-2-hydroxyacyl-CoA dehydratese activating ATPase